VTRVVLDTNVLISAVLYGGNPRTILEAALSGAIEVSVSEAIIQEFQAVLLRPRFGLSVQFVHNVVAELTSLAEWVTPEQHHQVVIEDPSDNLVLDCAVAANAQYLVTGDAHLLRLQSYQRVAIITPQYFIEVLQGVHGE
jgi:putative PIN family toxin of toxin-antitoxin system